MMSIDVKNAIFAKLRSQWGMRRKIMPSESLYHDIGIYGDDALEFFQYIENEYGVDFTEIRLSDYVPSEGDAKLIPYFRKRDKRFKRLPISQILKIAEAGKWIP